MRMNGEGIGGLVPPQNMYGPGQNPQHPASPLESTEGRQLLGQDGHCFRVQWVSAPEKVRFSLMSKQVSTKSGSEIVHQVMCMMIGLTLLRL